MDRDLLGPGLLYLKCLWVRGVEDFQLGANTQPELKHQPWRCFSTRLLLLIVSLQWIRTKVPIAHQQILFLASLKQKKKDCTRLVSPLPLADC